MNIWFWTRGVSDDLPLATGRAFMKGVADWVALAASTWALAAWAFASSADLAAVAAYSWDFFKSSSFFLAAADDFSRSNFSFAAAATFAFYSASSFSFLRRSSYSLWICWVAACLSNSEFSSSLFLRLMCSCSSAKSSLPYPTAAKSSAALGSWSGEVDLSVSPVAAPPDALTL